MSSRDYGFLTLRNTVAYQENGNPVPPNNIFVMSTSGVAVFSDNISISTIVASTIINNTLITSTFNVSTLNISTLSTNIVNSNVFNNSTVNTDIINVNVFNASADAGAFSSIKLGIQNLGPNFDAVAGSTIVYVGDIITISGEDSSACECDDNTGICNSSTTSYGGFDAELRKSGTGSLNIPVTGSGADRTFTVNNNMALSASLGWTIYIVNGGGINGC